MDDTTHFRLGRSDQKVHAARLEIGSAGGYRCRSATIMIHVSAILSRQSRIFGKGGGWPRGGRTGLKRFDKTRIDAGTPHGLLRVTVNGISVPTTHRETPYLAFNYDFDFDFVAASSRPFFCPRFHFEMGIPRLTFVSASRLQRRQCPISHRRSIFLKKIRDLIDRESFSFFYFRRS